MQKNKNRQGYKNTRVGWIPKEWGFNTLAALDIAVEDGDRGHHYPKQTEFSEGGHCLFLNAGNVTDHGFVFNKTQFVNKERDRLLRKGKLKRGDIVVTTRGTIGNFAHYDSFISFDHVRINSGMAIIRNEGDDISTRFLSLFFASSVFRKELCRLTFGSAVPQLTIQLINSFPLVVPPSLPEQEAIAKVLECWDKAIRGYERKIEKKRKIKKGLMQRLLSGKQRLPGFDGEWKEVCLGAVANVNREALTATTPEDQRFFYIDLSSVSNGRIACPRNMLRFGDAPSRARRLFRKHDILMSTVRPNLLGHGYVDFDAADMVCSTGFAVISCATGVLEPSFLYAYLFSEKLNTLIQNLLAGSSYPAINASDVSKLPVPLPNLSEQEAIASVLSSADAEIAALEHKLTMLREQKRFLLNNMVTGTIRLPQFLPKEAS